MERLNRDQGLYESRREHDACGIGAVVNIGGEKSHKILEHGNEILLNLHHRGAAGADEVTGDGAGILFQIPHDFFREEVKDINLHLPGEEEYGVGMLFNSKDATLARRYEHMLHKAIKHYGLRIVGWRDVPVDNSCLGDLALRSEPGIKQFFVVGEGLRGEALEDKLFLARRRAEKLVKSYYGEEADDFYIPTLSCRTICYKGMFMAWQLFSYYPDLKDARLKSALAIVHQRYSTNTFPSWKLAQPFRSVAHNGEINTLSGNRNSVRGMEPKMHSDKLGELEDVKPVVLPESSDSASFDNMLELLVRSGRSMPHSMMMMIPEAFGQAYHISRDKRAFYEYHSSIMEPWDGPAAMVFTDGKSLGGMLDRNGLRPCRYVVTTDGMVVIGSEAGVVQFEDKDIRKKGRLHPGRMFLVDTEEGRIVTNNEIKGKIARQKPYRKWLEENRIDLRGFYDTPELVKSDPEVILRRLRTFGYTTEELQVLLSPMAMNGQEPIGSMGNDAPLAVLSDKPKLLFNYFKQMFAQVTNPPIDPLREGLVMSLMQFTGKKENVLDETPEHCRQLKIPHPILTNEDVDMLRNVKINDFNVATVDSLFKVEGNAARNLEKALDKLVEDAAEEIEKGASLVIVSDKNFDENLAPIPSLLAASAVHHGLLKKGLRSEAGLVIESGEPREVMHFCLLCGFGANAVNPYLAFEALDELKREGELPADLEPADIVSNYIAAVKKGILKTMSKMGISTLRSYHNAQLFEAIGLNKRLVDRYFTGVSSRIEGIDLDQIAKDAVDRHRSGFSDRPLGLMDLDYGGDYKYRLDGEEHLWTPTAIAKLHHAVRNEDVKAYEEFAAEANNQSRKLCTLRGLFDLNYAPQPVPLDEVEPASEIVKRFCTGAMSHGSISKEAHECMAVAMNRLGGMSNTGEGGEDPGRYVPEANGDSRNCAIKQVASGRFGVTAHYLANAKEIQIKMAQGAKPGEGGQLPGHKVTKEIAKMRFSTPGVTLISPPPHHDIYSIEDLAQLIYDLKCSNPGVKVSVKLVSEVGVGTIAAGVAKGNADEVLISGHDGGTGASPQSSIKHAGCPWELGLAETQQTLVLNGLRDRIRVQTDGVLRTGRDVVVAALLGAEQYGFGTAALITMGCTLLRKCHEGSCVFGIATQDEDLRKRFAGKPEYIQRYMLFVAEEARRYMAKLGFRSFDEMVGSVEKLKTREAIEHWKSKGLDFSSIFHKPDTRDSGLRLSKSQADKLGDNLDWEVLKKCEKAIEKGEKIDVNMPIRNIHRTVGAILSNRIIKKYGPEGLPEDTVNVTFNGSAGQSFGAFLAKGVTLKLVGESNDYVGKGLSGGKIVVVKPGESPFMAHENIIVGNTLLYGATQGEVFINGMAGERFAVRNSGATAVVEGVGDHACEYMTGGTVVVLGSTGCNFAAGMSGGIAYVLDEIQLFDTLCNLDMVDLETVWREGDKQRLRELIEKHYEYTQSKQARRILDAWPDMVGRFVKVVPIDYRKALEKMWADERRDTETTPATEEVF